MNTLRYIYATVGRALSICLLILAFCYSDNKQLILEFLAFGLLVGISADVAAVHAEVLTELAEIKKEIGKAPK